MLVVLLLGACQRPSTPEVERLAVLPFQNLSGDPQWQWLEQGAATALMWQWSGSASRYVWMARDRSEALAQAPTRVLSGRLDTHRNRLRLHVDLFGVQPNRRIRSWVVEGPPANGWLPVLAEAARQMSPEVRPYGTSNQGAFQRYAGSLQMASLESRIAALKEAVEADREYGQAWTALVEALAAAGRTDEARAAIRRALESGKPDNISGYRLRYMESTFQGDTAGATEALVRLAGEMPADPLLAGSAAEARLAQRRLDEAAVLLRKALRVHPSLGTLWNRLAYVEAHAGDFEGASASLKRYAEAEPGNPNVEDSSGEISFLRGDFDEAERRFLAAHGLNANFLGGEPLWKAAQCRLWKGDPETAEQLFQQFIEQRKALGDPHTALVSALWDYLTGRRDRAMQALEAYSGSSATSRPAAAAALAHLALWSLETGSRERARSYALKAQTLAAGSPAAVLAKAAAVVTQPASARNILEERVKQAFPEPAEHPWAQQTLGVALLAAGQHRQAADVLGELLKTTHPFADGGVSLLLAWALLESGNAEAARPLLERPHLMKLELGPACEWPPFPRILFLRGQLRSKLGDPAGAGQDYRLFLKYAGNPKTIFDEEDRAQAALR